MKKFLSSFFILSILATAAFSGDAVIFSGSDVKALKQNLNLADIAKLLTGTADPTSSAQSAPQGSLYLRTGASGGTIYVKQDAGSSTNWNALAGGSFISSTLSDGNILVGNASNVATSVNPSGDIDVSNAGVFSISAGVIVNNDVNASAAIERSKLASGTNYRLLANNSSGVMSENAALTAGGVPFADANGQLSTRITDGMYWDDTNKRLGIGKDPSINSLTVGGTSYSSLLTVDSEGATDLLDFGVHRHSDVAGIGSHVTLARSRNTNASPTVVQSGDIVSRLSSVAHDGTDYEIASIISTEVDGTPGAGDMPGRIVFNVTPDGSGTPAEAVRISSDKTLKLSGSLDTALSTAGPVISDASGILSSESQLAASRGGTGQNFSASTGAISVSGGTFSAGTLAISNGGTGQTSASSAFNALSPMTTLGDTIYGGASGAGTRLAGNTTTTKKFLQQVGDGANSAAPTWTQVGLTDGVTGTLPVSNGGTGASTLTANNVILGNGTSAVQFVAPSTSGNVLTSNGTTWTSAAAPSGLSITGLTGVTLANDDYVAIADTSDSNNNKKALASDFKLDLVAAKTSGYTMTANDNLVTGDSNGGAFTFTLPAAASHTGRKYTFVKIGTGTNPITIDANSTETISGALTMTLTYLYDSLTIVCDGSNWHVLRDNTTTEYYYDGYTGYGDGSNSKIVQLANARKAIGTGVTAASDSTNGTTFTVNEPGTYDIHAGCARSANGCSIAITINDDSKTTNVSTPLAYSNGVRGGLISGATANSEMRQVHWTGRLAIGNVVRMHTDGETMKNTAENFFSIAKARF